MATLEIPIEPATRYQDMELVLDGRRLVLETRWNERVEAYFLQLRDMLDNVLLSGKRVVAGWNLLDGLVDDRLPPGALLALDTTDSGDDPKLGELGARVKLLYMEAADLAAETAS